jgi:hypothetical protein
MAQNGILIFASTLNLICLLHSYPNFIVVVNKYNDFII